MVLDIRRGLDSLHVVWVRESYIDLAYVEKIVKLLEASLICLDGNFENGVRQIFGRIRNVRRLKKERDLHGVTDLYIFSDLSPEAQYLAMVAKHNKANISLVEDGVAIYDIGGVFSVDMLKVFLARLLYGWWWKKPSRIGGLLLHKTIYAVKPELVRKDISLDCNILKIICNKKCEEFLEYESLEPGAIVFLMPFIGRWDDSVNSLILKIKGVLQEWEGRVYLKFHPIDKIDVIDCAIDKLCLRNFSLMKSDVPAEVYFANGVSDVIVVGMTTSSLHIISNIFSSVRAKYVNIDVAKDWAVFYKKMGVEEYKIC